MNTSYLMLIFCNGHHCIDFDTNTLSYILVIRMFLLAEKIPICFCLSFHICVYVEYGGCLCWFIAKIFHLSSWCIFF